MRLEQISSKPSEAMFRYQGNYPTQQFQHPAEYLSQVAALQGGPFPESGVVHQHGTSPPTAWTGTGIELSPTTSAASTHNTPAAAAAIQQQQEAWAQQYGHGNQPAHITSPSGHIAGSPSMAGYPAHDGFMTHPGHHGPDSVTQALYPGVYKGQTPYDHCWVRTPTYRYNPQTGKTRTKDKYRVVYSDHQRQKLEDEFRYNRYITIRRKAEIAMTLGLSDRQVKIWFQNRRAKERKVQKKLQLAASGQQEKTKAPSQQNQQRRDQTTEVKQESKVPAIKNEGSPQTPTTKPEATAVAGVPSIQNGVTLSVNGSLPSAETKYARSLQLKHEYANPEGSVRMIAHGPGLEVTTSHMGVVGGYPGVPRETIPVPVLQYTTS